MRVAHGLGGQMVVTLSENVQIALIQATKEVILSIISHSPISQSLSPESALGSAKGIQPMMDLLAEAFLSELAHGPSSTKPESAH